MKTAMMAATATEPKERTVVEAEEAWIGEVEAGEVPVVLVFGATEMVVWGATPVTPAMVEAGAGVPVTKATDEEPVLPAAGRVVRTTWGTVTTVEITLWENDEGITVPEVLQGTVTVFTTVTVVTGPTIEEVAVAVAVMEEEQVKRAGLVLRWFTQIPWKKL